MIKHVKAVLFSTLGCLLFAPAHGDAPVQQNPNGTEPDTRIVRAQLTSGITNREPVDEIVTINKNRERIYFFTEFSGFKGKIIQHRWEHQNRTLGDVSFTVASENWRCYSMKNISPEWTGVWTVSVIDDNNNVLSQKRFEVTE